MLKKTYKPEQEIMNNGMTNIKKIYCDQTLHRVTQDLHNTNNRVGRNPRFHNIKTNIAFM